MGRSRLSREEIYHVCKFQLAGTCIKEHTSSRSGLLLFYVNCFFWLTFVLNQRCTEEGLLVACDFFSQLRLPNCLETGLLLLFNCINLAYSFQKEIVATIIMLYKDSKATVGSSDRDIDFFDIVAGVLQGNTLTPFSFIICVDYVLWTGIDLMKNGLPSRLGL